MVQREPNPRRDHLRLDVVGKTNLVLANTVFPHPSHKQILHDGKQHAYEVSNAHVAAGVVDDNGGDDLI